MSGSAATRRPAAGSEGPRRSSRRSSPRSRCWGNARFTAREVATLAYDIERHDLGISGGWQDQYAAAFGGFNLLEFSAAGVTVNPVRAAPELLERLERHLLLCYTGGVRRNVGLIDTQLRMYHEGREETMLGLKQLLEMAYAMRETIERGRVEELGAMLHQAFEAKLRMNPHVAEGTPIETMLARARNTGASGGKICGAGGGGYLLIACPPERRAEVRDALEALGGQLAPFRFHPIGVRAWRGADTWAPSPEPVPTQDTKRDG